MRRLKREEQAKRYAANPEQSKTQSALWNAELKSKDPVKYTCKQMKASAKKRAEALGIPFDLTLSFLVSIAPRTCPVFGRELKYGGGDRTNQSPALDRIDSTKGYTIDNVQIISQLANLMKSNATEDELKMFAKWVVTK
jgi:hypothetical protein